jgi:hypothetical protein
MFVGVNDDYIDFVDSRLLYAVDTKIHHVEVWGSFAKNFDYHSEIFRGRDPMDETEYRQVTIQWGKGAHDYASWKWQQS